MVDASFRGNLGDGGGQWFNRKGPFLGVLEPFGARQGPECTSRRCTNIEVAWLALVLVPREFEVNRLRFGFDALTPRVACRIP